MQWMEKDGEHVFMAALSPWSTGETGNVSETQHHVSLTFKSDHVIKANNLAQLYDTVLANAFYLKIEDDCPDETENDGRLSIDDIRRINVD